MRKFFLIPVVLAFSVLGCGDKSEAPESEGTGPAGSSTVANETLPDPPPPAPKTDHLPGGFPDSKPTIENFLAAANWLERLKFIYAGDQLRDKIESYYETHPDGPIDNFHLKYLLMDENPIDKDYPLYVFFLNIAGEPEFPVTVRKTPDGMKVDWEIFTEFRDRRFEKFIQSGENGPAVFRIILKRASYYGKDREQMAPYLSFQLESAFPGAELFAFVPKDSPLSPTLEEFYGWGTGPIATTVEIERQTLPHGQSHFMINRLVSHPESSDGWHVRPGGKAD